MRLWEKEHHHTLEVKKPTLFAGDVADVHSMSGKKYVHPVDLAKQKI